MTLAVLICLALPAVAATKRNVYMTGQGTNEIAAMDIGGSGELTAIPGSPYPPEIPR